MKYIVSIITLILFSNPLYADQLTEYEDQYQNINQLKGKLEQLELQVKIQAVQLQMKKNSQLLNEKPVNKAKIEAARNAPPTFNPELSQVLYILSNGSNRRVVFSFNGQSYTRSSGEKFSGWNINIAGKNVVFSKGNKKIKR